MTFTIWASLYNDKTNEIEKLQITSVSSWDRVLEELEMIGESIVEVHIQKERDK